MKALFIVLILAMTACSSEPMQRMRDLRDALRPHAAKFSNYYQINTKLSGDEQFIPHEGGSRIIHSIKFVEDCQSIWKQGYLVIGICSLVSDHGVDESDLAEFAEKLGADVVIWNAEYSGIQQGVMPVTSFQPGRTATSFSYGAIGGTPYNGVTTTQLPATTTTQYVPVTTNVFQYTAMFWRKEKKAEFDPSTAKEIVAPK
ncbi:MAG TPA: hypothetical protein VGM64_15540 [Lacunisphaera sp.]